MKLELTIKSGTLAGRRYELQSGFLTIGRSETCSIRFDPMTERAASKQHAFIEAKADGYYLTDNRSTNGTYVNGQRVSTVKLNSGDQIQFGTNGNTANVHIDYQPFIPVQDQPHESFRDYQIEQYNQTAAREPSDLQSSLQNFGLGHVDVKPEAVKKRPYAGIAITIFAVVLMSLVVLLILSHNLTFGAAVTASVIAFVPATLYIFPLIWLDRYDPEPSWLLALSFAWGALVAVIISYLVNTGIAEFVMAQTASPDAAIVAGAVISAPIFEEASKGIGVLILLIFFRRYFDDVLDGIVFAGVIALGFATVENVLYYGKVIQEAGVGSFDFRLIFLVRGVFSPFAHVTFTAMTGIACGISRESHNIFVRVLVPMVGYGLAVALHMIWNGVSVFFGFWAFATGYLVLGVPFFAVFVTFSLLIMRRQNRILREMLAIDIARGLIPQEHAKIATSAFRSSAWILGGLFNGKFGLRSKYVRAIGKLGLSYWHIQRATAAQGQTGSFQQNPILREEVLKWRDKV
jgi:protease PrsW